MLFSINGFYCVVAEIEGRIAGSNCLDERSIIRGVGPITIDPTIQNRGVGRKLMEAVIDRSHQRGAAGSPPRPGCLPQSLPVPLRIARF